MRRCAVLDIGTNTFHLLIVEGDRIDRLRILYAKSLPVKLKEGGFENGAIRPEPYQRGLNALHIHAHTLKKYQVTEVQAIGTSALRDATNSQTFIDEVKSLYGIDINIISGNQEAELIYRGVNCFDHLTDNSLIVDIGGGSVEFIVANGEKLIWKKSLPLGASALKNKFQKEDLISPLSLIALDEYLGDNLQELFEVAKENNVKSIVGTSGSFETIYDILSYDLDSVDRHKWARVEIDIPAYRNLHRKILFSTNDERLQIPGMTDFRADMMVVGSALITYIITNIKVNRIYMARTAIKEGLLWAMLSNRVDEFIK